MMNIGEKILNLRQERNWSQDELAEKISVAVPLLRDWESGHTLPTPDKIVLLSEAFSISPDFFIKDDEQVAASEQKTEPVDQTITVKPAKKKLSKKIVALLVATCILVVAIIPYPLGLYCKAAEFFIEEPVQYPTILVHGLGGWGADVGINDTAPYWGASTGNLVQYLKTQGYDAVYEASVGPFSSTWDRTCELYAQLTGTTVDYGEAHAKENNHERYGRTYDEPLFEGWGTKSDAGQIKKINLISHSFGGPTIRLLASLLDNGASEENQAVYSNVSPLFEGGHGDWVNSITTLNSPNNGSTLVCVLDEYKLTTVLLDACLAFAGIAGNSPANGYLDFQLEQFGISSVPGEEKSISEMRGMLERAFSTGTDNAVYDLSLVGAAQLNKRIETVEGVTYFSYAYCTTKENFVGHQVPELDTLLVLMPTAYLMGRYAENTVSDITIDKTWLPNDGLVNVVSAQYPFDEPWKDFDAENIEQGKWNVMPTRNGDHGTVIGLNADTQVTHSFYTELFALVDSVPREKKYYFKF